MAGTDEKLLLKALRSEDETELNKAFEKIYYDYVKLVAFVAGKYVHNAETVKEIVNETFFRMFSHAENVRNIKNYLTTTAKNLSLDYLKRIKPTQPLEDFIFSDAELHSSDYNEVIAALKRVLRDDEVEIIIMHLAEGYTFREIAAKTGKKQNSVITVYNRAVKKYAKEYRNET